MASTSAVRSRTAARPSPVSWKRSRIWADCERYRSFRFEMAAVDMMCEYRVPSTEKMQPQDALSRNSVLATRYSVLQSSLASLFVTDADSLVDVGDENLAIADLAGLGAIHNGVDGPLGQIVGHHHLNLHLGHQVHGVLASAVYLGVSLLAAVAAHIGDRHSINPDLLQPFLDRFELGGLNDCFDFGHDTSFEYKVPSGVNATQRRGFSQPGTRNLVLP